MVGDGQGESRGGEDLHRQIWGQFWQIIWGNPNNLAVLEPARVEPQLPRAWLPRDNYGLRFALQLEGGPRLS